MKKYLMMAAVLVGQLFAMDSIPLTARFITTDDLQEGSSIHEQMKTFVGANTEEKWAGAVTTMAGQIAANVMRRVLFFRGDQLVTSSRSGGMPLHIYPAVSDTDGSFTFENGQDSIANAYRGLLTEGSFVEDLFEKPGFTPGLTWRIREAVEGADPQEILAVTLMPNEVPDASLIAEMHKAAYGLFGGMRLAGSPDRLPSLYVSMVPNVAGIAEANFGEHLAVQPGLHNYFPANADGMRYIVAGHINR